MCVCVSVCYFTSSCNSHFQLKKSDKKNGRENRQCKLKYRNFVEGEKSGKGQFVLCAKEKVSKTKHFFSYFCCSAGLNLYQCSNYWWRLKKTAKPRLLSSFSQNSSPFFFKALSFLQIALLSHHSWAPSIAHPPTFRLTPHLSSFSQHALCKDPQHKKLYTALRRRPGNFSCCRLQIWRISRVRRLLTRQ